MKISWARCILFTLFVALWISTCSSLKGVDVENPIVNFTPSFLVQPSGESKDTLSCDRIKISGKSRRKLDSYANAYRVTLVPSVVIPETLHSKIQICFHKNASLGSCQCENDNWRSVQNGLWYSVMSPYEDKFLDVRFTGKVLGSVTVTLEEDFQQWRVVCLAVGFVLQLLAPIVSSWVPFYYSSSMAIGIFLVVIILLFQGMKLLPTGRKNFLYLSIYTSVFGAGSYLLHQFSIMINSILLNFGFSEEMHNPVSLLVGLLIGLAGAALGLWLVRKFVISDDGSVDDGVAQFVKWAMRLVGFTCVFQSTLDTSLALTAQGICLMICLASTRFKWKNLDQRNQWLNMSSGGKAKKGKKMSRIEIIPENAEYEDMEDQLRSIGDETPSDDTGEQEENSTRQEKDSTRKRKRSNKSVIPDASSKEQSKEQSEQTEATVNPYAKKERKKRSESWKYLVQYTENGEKWARCTICQLPIKRDKTCSTTQLNRHVNKCKLAHGLTKQTQLQFKKDGNTSEVTLESFIYDHAEMRKTVAHYILINELPFLHVESFMFNEVMRKATPLWQKISRATVKADCVTTYEIEKKKLKEVFKSVKKINITTDMWTSSNQKIGYMVVTSHWIDSEWRLNMRVLNFCNVPPPHSGYVIADAISRCLNEWGIDDKIGTIVVDNAKNNDVALRSLKDIFTIRNPLPVGGKLFHARCCAHILNLCVQDGLKPIESIVDRIRDGVKYVAASEGRRIKFAEISQQLHLKTKKLILDVSTRWNSTFNMLQCASEFKQVFSRYGASDLGFRCYVPDEEDWEKVNWVCSILGAFNEVTKIVSGTHYPTSNLFLSELKLVKHILDKKAFDPNLHIREMTEAMKEKFDKYWGESNLVMSIGAVLDPRFKMKLPTFCFPTLYPKEGESERNLTYLSNVLNDLYNEYVKEDKAGKKKEIGESSDVTSADNEFNQNSSEVPQGLNDYESFIRASGAIQEPLKSELDDYLGEKIVFSGSKNFDVLSWWKANSAKYPVLSHMARDILSIPMSTVASESTFSAGSRVIEPHRSCLKPETVEMLLCGADWARELYGLKRTMQGNQDMLEDIEIDLSI